MSDNAVKWMVIENDIPLEYPKGIKNTVSFFKLHSEALKYLASEDKFMVRCGYSCEDRTMMKRMYVGKDYIVIYDLQKM